MASDGLWDTFSNEEACVFVREHIHERDFGAKSLAMQSYYRGSVDNITVLVIVFRHGVYTIGAHTQVASNSIRNFDSGASEDEFNLRASNTKNRLNYEYNANGPKDSNSANNNNNNNGNDFNGVGVVANSPKISAASIIASTNLNRSNSFRAK